MKLDKGDRIELEPGIKELNHLESDFVYRVQEVLGSEYKLLTVGKPDIQRVLPVHKIDSLIPGSIRKA